MILKLKLVKVDHKYCDYLRLYDKRVAYNSGVKELRPFVGVLFRVHGYEYFAPLSSFKKKHLKMKNTIDFFKIKNGELGVINFNNMIPVTQDNYKLLSLNQDTNNQRERKKQMLLKKQLFWLNKNEKFLHLKSKKIYDDYCCEILPQTIRKRCCNFVLLEEKCLEYNKKYVEK